MRPSIVFALACGFVLSSSADGARADFEESSPDPVPTSSPKEEEVAFDDLPTVTEDAAGQEDVAGQNEAEFDELADPVPGVGEGWTGPEAKQTVILGLRAGIHAFEPGGFGGDSGVSLEFTGAIPVRGPFYFAGSAGYHTGTHEVNNERSFFDAQFGSVEGQYRRNVGAVNTFTGLGVGFLSANTANIVRGDGLPVEDHGTSLSGHAVAGAHLPVGRIGLVGSVKYAFAPVLFEDSRETLPMGGLTLAVGFDFGF